MKDWTPDTEHIREIYAQDALSQEHRESYEAEFDRWLATHEAKLLRKTPAEHTLRKILTELKRIEKDAKGSNDQWDNGRRMVINRIREIINSQESR